MFILYRMSNNYTIWGPATWILFHSLAEKIKEERYTEIKNELIYHIKEICTHLPCPDCSRHAENTLTRFKSYDSLNTKDKFKDFLFDFHNIVNTNTGKPQVSKDVLEKYKTTNIDKVFSFWYKHFEVKSGGNNTLMIEQAERDRVKKKFQNFLHLHSNFFIQ